MTNFLGGSAYTMAAGIADGYHAVTERTFKNLTRPELQQLVQEFDRHLRECRAEQPPLHDTAAVQQRARKIQRLNTALMILRVFRQKHRI